MKKLVFLASVTLLMLFLSSAVFSQATVDKKAAELKKLEAGIATANLNVAKNEKLLAVADSLVSTGTTQIAEAKAEAKTLAAERKKLDKDYATSKKPLEKLLGSKDKAEATQAKADIKALDTQYKTDVKAMDLRTKDNVKKSATGTTNVTKGKTGKKTAETGLKTTMDAADAAQAKYDAAAGVGQEDSGDKKKKK